MKMRSRAYYRRNTIATQFGRKIIRACTAGGVDIASRIDDEVADTIIAAATDESAVDQAGARGVHFHQNRGRYIRHVYTAHQIALAQRGNPAKGLVTVELSSEDRQL